MTRTLAALERLSRDPPQALLLSDAEPLKIVRSADASALCTTTFAFSGTGPERRSVDIATVRRELETRRAEIKIATRGLETERGRLNALILHKAAERRRMMTETRQVDDRFSDLTKRASNLRELFADLRAKTVRSTPKPIERPSRTLTAGRRHCRSGCWTDDAAGTWGDRREVRTGHG